MTDLYCGIFDTSCFDTLPDGIFDCISVTNRPNIIDVSFSEVYKPSVADSRIYSPTVSQTEIKKSNVTVSEVKKPTVTTSKTKKGRTSISE